MSYIGYYQAVYTITNPMVQSSKFLKHVFFKSKDNPSVIFQIVVNILIVFVQCSYYMHVLLQNPSIVTILTRNPNF